MKSRVKKNKKDHLLFNPKGITLIELLIALVIFGIVVAGIYRLFVAQSKAYTVQDQVAEVQQNIRGAMEILLRDLRMTGFDDDNLQSTVTITNPIIYPLQDNSINVSYEYYNRTTLQYERHVIRYWRDTGTSRLMRQATINDVAQSSDILLENVEELTFTYGIDQDTDGIMDDRNGDGSIDDNDWVAAASVGNSKVVAIHVVLTARPIQVNPDLQMVSPRTLISSVTLRNLSLIR